MEIKIIFFEIKSLDFSTSNFQIQFNFVPTIGNPAHLPQIHHPFSQLQTILRMRTRLVPLLKIIPSPHRHSLAHLKHHTVFS